MMLACFVFIGFVPPLAYSLDVGRSRLWLTIWAFVAPLWASRLGVLVDREQLVGFTVAASASSSILVIPTIL